MVNLHSLYKKMNKDRLANGESTIVHDLADGPQPQGAATDQAALIRANNARIVRRHSAKKEDK